MELCLPAATSPLNGSVAVPGDKSLAHRVALFSALAAGDSLVIDMVMGGAVVNKCYVPAGGHVVMGGDMAHPQPVKINCSPLDQPGQWRDHKAYPDGNYMFAYNDAINGNYWPFSIYLSLERVPFCFNIYAYE